jgi:hypothetical protein
MRKFDPEDMATWPIPNHAVFTRWEDGAPRRVSEYGDGWRDGFERALDMANHWVNTGEWPDAGDQ